MFGFSAHELCAVYYFGRSLGSGIVYFTPQIPEIINETTSTLNRVVLVQHPLRYGKMMNQLGVYYNLDYPFKSIFSAK